MLHSSPMVYMNHTEPIFQDLLLYCTQKFPENHNNFFPFCHGVKHTSWCLLRPCFINLSLPSVYNTDRKRCMPHLCPHHMEYSDDSGPILTSSDWGWPHMDTTSLYGILIAAELSSWLVPCFFTVMLCLSGCDR